MSQITLSRELALRIGLAARAMPDTDAKSLLTVLSRVIGLPVTEKKLAALELKPLQNAYPNIDAVALTRMLTILKNGPDAAELPIIEHYRDGDMPGSVRIACASDDGVNVDGHFGSCRQFMIYQVTATDQRLIDIRSADIPEGLVLDDKNSYRAELIHDCKVVYMASVGGPAAAKIVKQGIHPLKLAEPDSIAAIIGQLQQVLAGTPPPWLAKAIGNEDSRLAQEAGA